MATTSRFRVHSTTSSSSTSFLCIVFLFAFCVFCFPTCVSSAVSARTGAGSAAIGQQLHEWVFSFSARYWDLSKEFHYYQSIFDFSTDMDLLSARVTQFYTTDRNLDPELRAQHPDIRHYPLLIPPIVCTYNVPPLPNYIVDDRKNESMVLTVELIADIYQGRITNWNDTRIQALNPGFVMPDLTIVPVAYSGYETSTEFFTKSLLEHSKHFAEKFPKPFVTWPLGSPDVNPNLVVRPGAFGTFSAVQAIPGAIGYMTLPVFNVGSSGTMPYVVLKFNGEVYLATQENVDPIFKGAVRDEESGILHIPKPTSSSKGWPMVAETNLLLSNSTNILASNFDINGTIDCDIIRGTMQYFRWALVDDEAQKQSSYSGFFQTPKHIREQVLQEFMEIECDGRRVLDLEVVDDHDEAYFEALLSFSMVCCALFLIPGILLLFTKDSEGKKAGLITIVYTVVLLFGALLVYMSMVFFYLVPDETWICQTRQWLVGIGFSIFLGALFTRTLQIYRVFRLSLSKSIKNRSAASLQRRGILDFVVGIGMSVGVQVTLLTVWTSVDTLEAKLSIISDIERTASWVCKSNDMWLWIGLEIGFFVCLLCYGILVVYRTWDLKSRFAESKWLLVSIYNLLLTLTALIPIFATIKVKDDNLFIMATAGLNFVVSSTLFLIYLPRVGGIIEQLIFKWRSHSDASGGTSGGTSTTWKNSTTASSNTNPGV